jgi:hypothetical protein
MSQAQSSFRRSPDDTPALLVGVAGYMDLREEEVEPLKARVRQVFRFLRYGPDHEHPSGSGKTMLDWLVEELTPDANREELREAYREGLSGWPDLQHTPIVVMSGLAPGADSLLVEVTLEPEFHDAGFSVRAPLSFPAKLYRDASTFVRQKGGVADPGNKTRQETFDQLLKAIGEEHAFAVRMRNDTGRTLDELQQNEFPADLQDSKRRHLRYYAAGEYLAVYCHLLLAIWNGEREKTDVGTAAVVEARLRGPRPGVLASSWGLQLAAGGPLLHLHARRAPKAAEPVRVPDRAEDEDVYSDAAPTSHEAGCNAPGGNPTSHEVGYQGDNPTSHEAACNLPPMRFLHPYIFSREAAEAGDVIGGEQHADDELQEEYLAMFCRTAQNLEAFNATGAAPADKQTEEFEKRLTYRNEAGREQPYAGALEAIAPKFADGLRRVSSLRVAATRANYPLDNEVGWTLQIMFGLALFAAVLLNVFADWGPRASGQAGGNAPTFWATLKKNLSAVGLSPLQEAAGIVFVAVVGAGLYYYARHHSHQHAERGYDYRALAEGLRVQFYWNLAGLGRSVSANYMQRQRSELDWIRAAIRSVSFPYEQWSDHFARLPRDVQITALHCVAQGWIDNQFDYFKKNYREHEDTHHAWLALGKALALAGFWTVLFWLLLPIAPAAAGWLGALGAICLFGLVIWALACVEKENARNPPVPRWQAWIFALVPGSAEHGHLTGEPRERFGGMAVRFRAFLPLSLSLALLAIGLSAASDMLPRLLPEVAHVRMILAATMLVGGGLAMAWGEKNLFSELAYQYHTMAGLFGHARQRLKRDLERLTDAQRELERLPGGQGNDEEYKRVLKEYEGILQEIQDFLFTLGREALDENAEWLLLHRARPLEPVMGG